MDAKKGAGLPYPPPLTNDNYSSWSVKMKAMLQSQRVFGVIENPIPAAPTPAWNSQNVKARSAMILCVSDEQLVHIADMQHAREIWQTLQRIHRRDAADEKPIFLSQDFQDFIKRQRIEHKIAVSEAAWNKSVCVKVNKELQNGMNAQLLSSHLPHLNINTIDGVYEQLPLWPPTDPEEIHRLISNLKIGKAPGPDLVPAEAIKLHADWWAKILAATFDAVNNSGKVPRIWKDAIIVPIHKKARQMTRKLQEYQFIVINWENICTVLVN
ncbi:Retrovirus-related Pol polyprotein from transposon TNT 1-94 [Podarcis lilfordi]|uniref:Retrovirus-related Pol polyprotein from transposon TNT 1-94 n=1 Tax=Podarcis lilfordi TaxID=74358 RepID=A0AA35PWJ4_9SAUR|nr:Retrovirus-related Pol polyprotein from transposon TNT 1-94 [Podarcis lilfordi]